MAGDTLALTIANDNVGTRTFNVQSDQSITPDLGGYTNARQINGNGTGHSKKAAKPWELAGLQLEYDPENGDQEFLQDIADSAIDSVVTWQHIDGYVYQGKGQIEGDIKADSNTGYIPITLMGSGKFDKIT